MSSPARKSIHQANAGRTFSLATLLLLMTICSVWLSIFMLAPVLAVLLFLPLAFAFLRTRAAVRVRSRADIVTPSGQKVELFVTSTCLGVLICFLTVVVGMISFGFLAISSELWATLSGASASESYWLVVVGVVGMLFCVVAMQITAVHFIWSSWPRRFDAEEGRFA